MLKILVALIVIVVPIFCALHERQFDAIVVKGRIENIASPTDEIVFVQQCKNISGIDVDLERNNRLYEEYEKCVKHVVDPKHLSQDFENITKDIDSTVSSNLTLSDEQNAVIIAGVQKYCPNAKNITTCDDILTPIYNECYTADENKYKRFTQQLFGSIFDFFCKNDAENAINFINQHIFDCIHLNEREYAKCFTYIQFGNPSQTKDVCKSMSDFKSCFIPKIEECRFSQTLGILVKSFLAHIHPEECDKANVS